VYSTLEPCFKRNSPKIGCCKRIAKARIKKVYVGTGDPFPSVNGKGIKYLVDHGIEVEPYPQELQKEIERLNADFIAYAESRRLEEENKATKDYKEETERAVHTMDMKSLDEKLMARFLKAANVTDNEQEVFLRNMNLAELDNDVVRPTGLGLLLFGKKPQSVYPNAVIKTTLKRNGKAVETKTIEGRIPAQLDEANKWYKEHIPSYINRDDAERKKVHEYPLDVIRELICNAVVHRDYSLKGAPVYFEINDKSIVIKSPGLPEPPVTLEHIVSFSASSFSRNPVIMYVLDKLDYAEQRGLGFETVKDLPAKNLPLPKVQYNAPYIEFILPLSMEVAETMYGDLSEKEIKVLEYIRINEPVTRSDIETLLGIDNKKAVRILNKLIDKGVIISQGKSRGVTYSVSGQFSGQSVSKN
ncbi:MAG: SMC-Scp complex subunit ScpB, partial [Prevotella sp.]|nr:SMC-Scp complex subunit ScpB [Prevotella sp.]